MASSAYEGPIEKQVASEYKMEKVHPPQMIQSGYPICSKATPHQPYL